MSQAEPPQGRRERNKLDKQQRIFEAADALFTEHGYSAVTTQQIADRADVAIGTLFRYASSKSELLLMAYNTRFRLSAEKADEEFPHDAGLLDQLAAILTPIVRRGHVNRENTIAYEQAMLFGSSHEKYRTEALDLMGKLQQRVAKILSDTWSLRHPESHSEKAPDATPAARAIYAALLLESIHATLTDVPFEQQLNDIMNQVDVISRGYLHPAPAHNATSAVELNDTV